MLSERDGLYGAMEFRFEWRKYQRMVLNLFEVTLTGHPVEPGLVEIEGEGGAWRPRHYVAVVTNLLERGVTRCVVGTRGLLGEGWDSLSLNTLIDLTTAGTYASVNQIRGRSIRLDPGDPHKVANNWDLVCYEPALDEGDRDLERLTSKHQHTWGLDGARDPSTGVR
ncbi:MAG: hypothetical protein M3406_08760 [Chloroflexota bacterium]|nr:hypothetical protein [Chloroflexota bacterium]